MKRIVLKISSGLVINNKTIQTDWLDDLAELMSDLQEDNYQLWLVTSGARAIYKIKNHTNELDNYDYKLGQAELFNLYKQSFDMSGVRVSEILLSKEEFKHRPEYLKIRDNLELVVYSDSIALINEKENINASHKFSDNDEIAGLIASVMNADRVVLASTVEGVLDHEGRCLPEVGFGQKFWKKFVSTEISETGRGGMLLKCKAAENSAKRGVDAIICDGKDIQNIKKAIMGEKCGTKFISDRRISAKKRWIFDKKDFSNGSIQVDEGLAAVFRSGKPVSLLTVGVNAVQGDFQKNEIVAIRDNQDILGYGEVRFDAKTTVQLINDGNSKLLIHYDQYVRTI